MNHRLTKTAAQAAGFLLVWTVILFVISAAVFGIAGNGKLLAQEMLRCAPPEETGLPEQEYPAVGQMTAAYLTGREPEFQYIFSDEEGRSYLCFHDYEADHMADCRELIHLAGRLRWWFGGIALVCAGICAAGRRSRKETAGGMRKGLTAAGAAVAILLIWGMIDFDGLFVTFHRIAFSNEGWLLDPKTDLLIRLMPTELFVSLGLKIAGAVTAAALVLLAAVFQHSRVRIQSDKREG